MVQAERVHRTQMSLNTTIITKRNDGLCRPLEVQGQSMSQTRHYIGSWCFQQDEDGTICSHSSMNIGQVQVTNPIPCA